METLQRTANRGSISGYDIDNSCKFEPDNNESLTKAAATGGDRKKATLSLWFKRTELTGSQMTILFLTGVNGNKYTALGWGTGDEINFHYYNAGSYPYNFLTDREFRDMSAWYHIVVAVDTTQGTAANRVKFYVNGVQETSFSTEVYPTQNIDTPFNNDSATYPMEIGNDSVFSMGGQPIAGYLADYYLIDGQQLAPTEFGEFDEDSGIWKPKAYTGTFGSNGFYLDFETSGSMGADSSGNSNDFSAINITSADQATDTPTNNFCTLNPNYQAQNTTSNYHTVSNGGTFVTGNQSATVWTAAAGTIPLFKGKWYWEIKKNGARASTNMLVGVGGIDENQYNWRTLTTITDGAKLMFSFNGVIYGGGSGGFSFDDGDIVSIALDQDNGGFYLRKNGGTWTNSGDPASGSNLTGAQTTPWGTSIPAFNVANNVGGLALNFGGFDGFTVSSGNTDANGYGNFEYAPPSGYYAICTKNLAEYG